MFCMGERKVEKERKRYKEINDSKEKYRVK
jgi:hypothetical protein